MKQPPALQSPPWWNLMQWIIQPLDLLEHSAKQHSDCFSVRFNSKLPPLNFFSHPQAIEQIFTAGASQFDSGRGNWILRTTLGDNSLLLLDGERHQRQRQLLMPPFHGERMRAYGQLIGEITDRVIRDWQVGSPFALRPYTQEISLRVMLRAVFGLDEGERYEAIKQRLESLLRVTASRFGFATSFFPVLQRDFGAWSPGGRFIHFKQQIDQLLYAEIRDRRNHPDPNRSDILSLLLAARDEAGQSMTDEELRDELITLLLAGHETTATAIAWAVYWIHQIPDIKTKLLAELETLGSEFEPMAIARLPYLNAICSETLRIYPVAFIAQIRITKAPVEVMGYAFEPENYLVPCIYLTHHREDLYPDPKQFKPERFLERQFSPFEYLPFGGSNRRCIGAAFALFEMKLVLATILSRYQLALAETRPVIPIRRGVTIAPKGGIRVVVTERLPSQPAAQITPVSI